MSIALFILGLILFVSLIVVHEFGHMVAARRNGVKVEEFAIGFPPQLWSKKLKSGMYFKINLLPIGGYVRLNGEYDSATGKGTYGAASLWAKTKIMAAGVGMNVLTAFVLLTLLAVVGMPKLFDNQYTIASDTKTPTSEILVGYVEAHSPAAQAGLKVQDRLVSLSAPGHSLETVTTADNLPTLTKKLAGDKVTINIIHQGKPRSVQVTLRSQKAVAASLKTSNPQGYLGVSPTDYTVRRSTWSAPIVAGGVMWQLTKATLQGLWHAVSSLAEGHASQAGSQVSGPVGIVVLLKNGSLLGYQFVLMIVAVISLTLAIMNVLPIPALDGGRLFVTFLYRGLRKRLTQTAEERIHGTGFAVLMLLVVLITVVDIRRF